MSFYIIATIIMPSPNVSLDDRRFYYFGMSENRPQDESKLKLLSNSFDSLLTPVGKPIQFRTSNGDLLFVSRCNTSKRTRDFVATTCNVQ